MVQDHWLLWIVPSLERVCKSQSSWVDPGRRRWALGRRRGCLWEQEMVDDDLTGQ